MIKIKIIYNMKYFRSLLILLFSIAIISCSDDDDGGGPAPVDPLDTQGNLLNGSWKVKDANSVTKDGAIVDVFTNMTLTVSGGSKSGGSYSTSNSDSDEIWPNSGTWEFQSGDKNKLLRSDGVVVSISLTETTLRTSFQTSGGLKDGNWVFDFIKQ